MRSDDDLHSIFDCSNYVDYLRKSMAVAGPTRGSRATLARHLRCQPGFISQVLTGRAHLSVEHAVSATRFFKFTQDEARYFVLLVQLEKSATQEAKQFFLQQLAQINKARQQIRERIQVDGEVRDEDKAIYYSNWHYAAIHVMTSLPQYQTINAIAEYMHLTGEAVKAYLAFLTSRGLVEFKDRTYRMTERRIHLGSGSAWLNRHHQNWRLRTVMHLDQISVDSMHYSSVIGIDQKAADAIRQLLVRAIGKKEEILSSCGEDQLYSFCLDFFPI